MAKKYHGQKSPMIGDGMNANAGLPEEKIMKSYPKAPHGCKSNYRDDLGGIDMLAKDNNKQINKKIGGRY